MGGGRFWYMPEAATLRDALASALWSQKRPGVDERLDDGTTDIDTLDAFEYTIERDYRRLTGKMNVSAFIEYLNKTKHLQLDAIITATLKSGGNGGRAMFPTSTTRRRTPRTAASFPGVWLPCGCRNMSARTGQTCCSTTRPPFQIGDAKSAAYLLGSDEQQTGGLLRQLHFWENANKLVEQAYWSGTGAFVLSVEGLTVDAAGNALPSPQGRIQLDYDPACCILPISVERGVVTEAAFVSECVMGGKPAVYLQTHTCKGGERTITNEWFEVMDDVSGTPKFAKAKTQPGMVEHITVTGAPAWFSLFSPAVAKNLDGGMGLGMSVFSEALDAAQMADYAFDNYRQDLRLGGKKIFYDRSMCKKWVDKDGVEHAVPPDAVHRQIFYELPAPEGSIDQPAAWREYNPDLRTEDNHRAVQDALDMMSFKCGLGCHRYSFELGKVATATEYTGSRQDLVQNANKTRSPLDGTDRHSAGHPVGGKEPAGCRCGPGHQHLGQLGRQLHCQRAGAHRTAAGGRSGRACAPLPVSVRPVWSERGRGPPVGGRGQG